MIGIWQKSEKEIVKFSPSQSSVKFVCFGPKIQFLIFFGKKKYF